MSENEKTTKRRLPLAVIILMLILIANIIWGTFFVVTSADEFTVVTKFGKIERIIDQPGVTFKGPLESTRKETKKLRYFDVPTSDFITKDKQAMINDCFVVYKLTDPYKYFVSLSGNQSTAELRISNLAYNISKNTLSTLTQQEIISGRGDIATNFYKGLSAEMISYGLELVIIETKKLDIPPENQLAVYERMRSERQNKAAQYAAEGQAEARKIRTQTDKEVTMQLADADATAQKLIAEGESKYMEILSQVYGDADRAEFYRFVRSLDAYTEMYQDSQNTTIFLPADSPLAELFYSQMR